MNVVGWLRAHAMALASLCVAGWLCVPSLLDFIVVARSRVDEGYALWWLEPLFYRTALASQQGLPLYPPPSLEHTPPIYNPALGVVGSLLIDLFGEGYPALRWFCLLCFGALACVIAGWTWRRTESAAVGLFALTSVVSLQAPMGRWITTINVDTPSVCLGVVGVLLAARTRPHVVTSVLSGLCITLGFLFKQPACLWIVPALSVLVLRDRRNALWLALSCAGSALIAVACLWLASDGWYWTYAFSIPTQTAQRELPKLWPTIFESHAWSTYGGLIAAPLLTWLGPAHLRALWLPWIGSAWVMGYAGFTKDGGDMNTLLPTYVAGALCVAMLPSCRARAAWSLRPAIAAWASFVVMGALVISGGSWTRDRMAWFSTRADVLTSVANDRAARPTYPQLHKFERNLRTTIARLPKPVFVGARFFGMRGPLNTHQSALYEGLSRTQLFDVGAQIAPRLQSHHYKSLVLWGYWHNQLFESVVRRYYVRDKKLGADPLIGLHIHVWLPKQN